MLVFLSSGGKIKCLCFCLRPNRWHHVLCSGPDTTAFVSLHRQRVLLPPSQAVSDRPNLGLSTERLQALFLGLCSRG
jgi:hypothetical protein